MIQLQVCLCVYMYAGKAGWHVACNEVQLAPRACLKSIVRPVARSEVTESVDVERSDGKRTEQNEVVDASVLLWAIKFHFYLDHPEYGRR